MSTASAHSGATGMHGQVVTLTIDGRQVQAPAGSTVLQAAQLAGIRIPTLCYHPDLTVRAVCRICVVEVKGARTLQAACSYPVSEGLEVRTNTPRIRAARKVNLELLLSNHPFECPTCLRNQNCELRELAYEYNINGMRFEGERNHYRIDTSAYSLVRDPNKCILCRRCVDVCNSLQAVGAIGPVNRGFDTVIAPPYDAQLADIACAMCGQCINRCPVGAMYEKDAIAGVWAAIADPAKHVVVQTAPAVRVALGEEFGMGPGGNRDRQAGRCTAQARLRRRVRHQLLSGSHHHGGGIRAYRAGHEGRRAAATHLLQPRLDQVHRALLPGPACRTSLPASRRSRCWAP